MSALVLPSDLDIRRYARGALVAAGALRTTPAPLDDITAAVGLHTEDLFDLGEDDEPPPGVLKTMRKLAGKLLGALALPEKTVYIDSSLMPERRRYTQGHEIGHEALPWHRSAYWGDDKHTLAADTRDALEREANAFSAELLFGLNRFTEQADDLAPGLAAPLELAPVYQTSAHATLRRYVERSEHALGLLVFGRYFVQMNGGTALKVLPYQCVESQRFNERYGPVAQLAPGKFSISEEPVARVAAELGTGIGEEQVELTLDTRRGKVAFRAEVFSNGHFRFVLLYKRRLVQGRRLRALNA